MRIKERRKREERTRGGYKMRTEISEDEEEKRQDEKEKKMRTN